MYIVFVSVIHLLLYKSVSTHNANVLTRTQKKALRYLSWLSGNSHKTLEPDIYLVNLISLMNVHDVKDIVSLAVDNAGALPYASEEV